MNKIKIRKPIVLLLIPILAITVLLIIFGFVFQKSEDEKQQGLTPIFDVSTKGTIAYVAYDKGKAGIYLKHAEETFDNPVLQLDTKQSILDIVFTPDGSSLAFVSANKDVQSRLESSVHLLSLQTLTSEKLFTDLALLTELAFDPQNEDVLFYLRAGTFENYSPIASAHPHEFDLYSYQISDQLRQQFTELSKYSMRSLTISPDGKMAYVQMPDDANVETAEDTFEMKQRVFQIPLDAPDDLSVVSNNDWEKDIYDFVIMPDRHSMIFQSVSQTGAEGIYEYELFYYDWDNDEEKQLTYLKQHTSHPMISPQNGKVYFMVDKQFGKRKADYQLYQMDADGENLESIPLNLKDH